MEKNHYILVSLLALASAGCNNDKVNNDNVVTDMTIAVGSDKHFTATTESYSPQTKTSLKDTDVLWKAGDQVSVFAMNTGNDQYKVSDEFDGKTSASLDWAAFGTAGSSLANNVAYYPYSSSNLVESVGEGGYRLTVSLPSVQSYAENSFGNGAFPMAAVSDRPYDLNLTFKNVLGGLELQLTGTATISRITVTGNNNEKLYGAATVNASNVSAPTIALSDDDARTVALDCGSGVTLDAETPTSFIIALPPMEMENGFTIDIYDGNGHQTVKTTKSQTIERSSLLVMPAIEYVPYLVAQAVDLGLNVKWASFNVGASAPEEFGDFFAWGDVDNYYPQYYSSPWLSYKWCKGSYDTMTKYCTNKRYGYNEFTDSKTVLDLDDDVAHVRWGGSWRIPTKEDFEELLTSCTWTKTSRNNVNGYLVTSTKEGYTDCSIFLPDAGIYYKEDYDEANAGGHYWSSSLDTSPYEAMHLNFLTEGHDTHTISGRDRHEGLSVRPVCP